jgi:hypothetical protein
MAIFGTPTRLVMPALPRTIHTMRPLALQTLTWATVIAAVASAMWLAVVESHHGSTLRWTAASLSAMPLPWTVGPTAADVAARRSAALRDKAHLRPAR